MGGKEIKNKDRTWWEDPYDEPGFVGDYFRKRMQKALAWIEERDLCTKDTIIFDAGCGNGQFVVRSASHGYRTIGMDYSADMLKTSLNLAEKQEMCKGRFFQGEVERIPVKDGVLDVIICLGVVSYLESEKAALTEFSRVLKPGGLLIVSATNKARLIKRLDIPLIVFRLGKKFFQRRKLASGQEPASLDDIPQRSYSIPGFYESLDDAGFNVDGLATFSYDLPTLFGQELFQRSYSVKIAGFIEKFDHLPLIESFGSMWMVKACKKQE